MLKGHTVWVTQTVGNDVSRQAHSSASAFVFIMQALGGPRQFIYRCTLTYMTAVTGS